MIRTEYHYMPDCDVWLFLVVDVERDEVIKQGSEEEWEIVMERGKNAQIRACACNQNISKYILSHDERSTARSIGLGIASGHRIKP